MVEDGSSLYIKPQFWNNRIYNQYCPYLSTSHIYHYVSMGVRIFRFLSGRPSLKLNKASAAGCRTARAMSSTSTEAQYITLQRP